MLGACMTWTAAIAAGATFSPGSAGLGDPYFPLDGNGGYDVKHYLLDITYNPDTDVLRGTAGIQARATQNLSRSPLFAGLTVDRSKSPAHSRRGLAMGAQELTVTLAEGLPRGEPFLVVVRYHGIPEPIEDELGISGFIGLTREPSSPVSRT